MQRANAMKTKYSELFQLDPNLLKFFDFYRQIKEIYTQTRIVLGQTPTFEITSSSAKKVRVINGTNFSTKIYTRE